MLADIPPDRLLVTYTGLTLIIALRYLLISGLFYWLLWARDQTRVRAIKLMAGTPRAGAVRRATLPPAGGRRRRRWPTSMR